ncbi:hypothetical protein MLD38_005359 [Melastoma candidum]|uniref:Uncharacterized protein n=1 Tax=Melastoma candidum TaxID=119954 RepID=A0ACB9SA56_9MYRT|nr:hypothetical protein MLD38_005359 [Melastoma candidum]
MSSFVPNTLRRVVNVVSSPCFPNKARDENIESLLVFTGRIDFAYASMENVGGAWNGHCAATHGKPNHHTGPGDPNEHLHWIDLPGIFTFAVVGGAFFCVRI